MYHPADFQRNPNVLLFGFLLSFSFLQMNQVAAALFFTEAFERFLNILEYLRFPNENVAI